MGAVGGALSVFLRDGAYYTPGPGGPEGGAMGRQPDNRAAVLAGVKAGG